MNDRERICKSLVEKYANDITLLVSTNECIIEVVEPGKIWIEPLGYEIVKDEIERYIELLN